MSLKYTSTIFQNESNFFSCELILVKIQIIWKIVKRYELLILIHFLPDFSSVWVSEIGSLIIHVALPPAVLM